MSIARVEPARFPAIGLGVCMLRRCAGSLVAAASAGATVPPGRRVRSRWPVRSIPALVARASGAIPAIWPRRERIGPRTRAFPPGPACIATGRRTASVTLAARASVVAVSPVITRAALRSADKLRRHSGSIGSSRADYLNSLRLTAPISFRGGHRYDRDALELEVGFGFQYVPRLGSVVQQASLQNPTWLPRASRPPGPRPIRSGAGQLDLDTSGHALTLLETTTSRPSRFAAPLACRDGRRPGSARARFRFLV
jgi:hypothetical protein